MPDDTDFDETPKATTESPVSDESQGGGFFKTRSASPTKLAKPQNTGNGIAFGDINSSSVGRRRLSTEQLPQTILDRRMRRASRSPSPLGHSRAVSVGTASAPLPSAPFAGGNGKDSSAPLVVNGSGLKAGAAANSSYNSGGDMSSSLASNFDNALNIQAPASMPPNTSAPMAAAAPPPAANIPSATGGEALANGSASLAQAGSPIVANGSYKPAFSEEASFRDRIAMMNSYQQAAIPTVQDGHNATVPANATSSKLAPNGRARPSGRNAQGGMIAPLDLAIADGRMSKSPMTDMAHLSPVYETRTPSPTTFRKSDATAAGQSKTASQQIGKVPGVDGEKASSTEKTSAGQTSQKPTKGQANLNPPQRPNAANAPRENGHVRGAKSESDGGWQKAGKGKKKATPPLSGPNHGEQLPKLESERKGG